MHGHASRLMDCLEDAREDYLMRLVEKKEPVVDSYFDDFRGLS